MMCPPHSVKMVSTPSFFSAFATRCPPETTPASRLFFCRVSSAVVVAGLDGTGAATLMLVPRKNAFLRTAIPDRVRGSRCAAVENCRPALQLYQHIYHTVI